MGLSPYPARLALSLLALALAANTASGADEAQRRNLERYETETLVPGIGVGSLVVGQSTLADVKKLFGETNAFDRSSSSSSIHHYANGLSFVTEPGRDPNGVVRRISAKENPYGTGAFRGRTDKGIGLGATREDVVAAYGEPVKLGSIQSVLSYRSGISFHLKKGTLTEIVIQKWPW